MRDSVIHVVELILGALLIGLGLLYLVSQQRSLSELTDLVTEQIIEDKNIYQQFNLMDINQASDKEVYAAIMGYREYPIMVNGFVIPSEGYDYELYFSHIRKGTYRKEYQYETNRRIAMIIYTYIGV